MNLDESEPEALDDADLARTGRLIALAGAVPFVLLAAWLYGIAPDHAWRPATIALLSGYGAVVLSFLGGIRWGIALTSRAAGRQRDVALSALPPLLGWAALLMGPPLVFGMLAVAFAAQGAWDSLTLPGAVPDWFGRLRIRLTILVVPCLLLALAATG